LLTSLVYVNKLEATIKKIEECVFFFYS